MGRFDFSLEEYDAPEEYGIIPEGTEVRMKCTEAEDKETSTGGEMVKATFVIVEGEYKNRKIWANFNTVNKSEKAQNFGRRMLSGWARAAGKPNAKSTDELLEKPFWCKLGVEAGSGSYKDKNIISSFLMPEGATSAAPSAKSSAKDSAPADTPKEKAVAPAAKEEKESTGAKSTPTPAATGKGKPAPWDD